ncbi:MAG: CARDB domain-containing protein [Candidatus Nanoarchaeia archaeon]
MKESTKNVKIGRKNVFVVLVMFLLILIYVVELGASQSEVYLSLNKQIFNAGERAVLVVNGMDSQDYKLEILSPTKTYSYVGELKSVINFYPDEIGDYIVNLLDESEDANDIILTSINFKVVGMSGVTFVNETKSIDSEVYSRANAEIIGVDEKIGEVPEGYFGNNYVFTNKEEYLSGEKINVFLNLSESQKSFFLLYYEHEGVVYTYLGDLNSFDFIPPSLGSYNLLLKTRDGNLVESRIITVSNQPIVGVIEDEGDLGDEGSNYLGEKGSQITAGDAEELLLKNKLKIEDNAGNTQEFSLKIISKKVKFSDVLEDTEDVIQNKSEKILSSNADVVSSAKLDNLKFSDALYDVEINFNNKPFKKLILFNLSANVTSSANLNIGIEEISPDLVSVGEVGNNKVMKAYGIDPSSISFSSGTISFIASGTELWKCKDWTFQTQSCGGEWVKVMNIIPGEEYVIEISPEDPGYAETGLATINTNKATFHINESAEISVVVLDVSGYLVADANVTVVVTNPNSVVTVYSTDMGTISEESKGIYYLIYDQTQYEGIYGLFVQAENFDVNYSMSSSFEVKEFYDFDILRSIPVTMDPWNENLSVSINFVSYNYTGSFSFTERLPSNFLVYSSDGGVVIYSEEFLTITWNDLTNNSEVNYVVGVPQISPQLYLIGPGIINYEKLVGENVENLSYVEARPWFLAVDPILFAQICDAQININGQNTFTSSCDGTYPAACGAAGDRLTCNDGQYETHTGSNNNRWSGVRISAYNSSMTDCDTIISVDLCYEWWQTSGYDVARIAVDNDDWASVSTVSSVVPGTSANPGITCIDVTALDDWVCGNFNGTGTAAQVVAQAQRTGAGSQTVTIDVLYFDVTYERIDNFPAVTQNTPANNYWNSTSDPFNVVFNCSITDDFKSQNISLYLTNSLNSSFAYNDSCVISGVNGSCQWTKALANGNYTWNCLGSDNKSQSAWAANRSVKINWSLIPPTIANIQCYDGSWTSCSNVLYGDTLGSVRVNCSSNNGGSINNATFVLKNINDDYIYFNSTITTTTNGLWEYNLSDIAIYDSGDFNLRVTCRENPESTAEYNWTVPWGSLVASLINPYQNVNVSQNKFFTFSSNVSCVGGECGYVEAILDPISSETADAGVVTDNDAGNDEEGGSYLDTQTNNGNYFAIGENTNGANDNVNSLIDFTFNLSDLGVTANDLNSINVSLTYCYSGANSYGEINCDGGNDAPEKTPNGAQDIWIYDYNTSAWVDIGNLDTSGGETETTDVFVPSGNLSNYISGGLVLVRVEYVTNNGNNNDAWLAIDYLTLNVDYTFLKTGLVSTIPGTIPFYTIDSNPQDFSDESCLGNMSAGNSCTIYWDVNATGEINTTHEFYVIYNLTSNSAYVANAETSHINITILQNAAPIVSYANIYPSNPGLSDDLSCSFIVSDTAADTLTATVYWYESNVLQYNQTVSVSNGVEYSHILGSGNTSPSDVWHCGVRPYDQELYGLQVNSSSVNISASNPPVISNMECQRFGAVWGSCSNVLFGDQFTAVRATCTDSDGYIATVNFTFLNQEDSYTYFASNYSNVSGSVYTLDFADIHLQDSGNFDLIVTCLDNSSVSDVESSSWFVPWGTLSSQLINPTYNINVTQNIFFNFTSRVTCTGGECGYINATLDPTPSWWNGNYRYRMRLNVSNNQAALLQAGYSMNVSINTSSSKFLANGNDLRIVWLNGSDWIELDRINESSAFNSHSTEIWFKLQEAIPASSKDDSYFVYYGYAGATNPPINRSKIYLYFDDFNRANVADITTEAAYHQTGGGTWSISGNKLVNIGAAGDPNKLEIAALGDVSYDVDMLTKINIYSTLGSASDLWRMGLSSNIDDVGGDGSGYALLLHEDHSSLDLLNDLRSWGTYGSYSWNVDTWYNMRFRVINPSARVGYGKIWDVGTAEPSAWTINAGTFGTGTARGYGEVGFGGSRQGDTTHFDDIIVRYIVTNEPSAEQLLEEEYGLNKLIVPMNSGDPFYTITANPMDYTTTACLANMVTGDYCDTTWSVNATGSVDSTWEFFVIYESDYSYVAENLSNKINITIVQNLPPAVYNVTLTPSMPLYSDDLYCNFTVLDSSALDILNVNVTWYLNNVYNRSLVQTVSNGVRTYQRLAAGNTSAGQVWSCGVRPYDQNSYGIQVNSSNVTILLTSPPVVNSIQCMEFGSWVNCSNLGFNDVLQGVRVNCTSSSGVVSNVTFNFSNTPDAQTYFKETVYTSTAGFWVYNETVTLNNSGEFRVDVLCADNNSQSTSSYVSWSLPWGTINISLINPSSNAFVEQNDFFNFSAQIECVGGECGRVEVTLDPISGSSPATGTPDRGYVFDNPGNDEEGGSYVQTQTYNGPQTATPGTNFYYIIGEGDTANTALSYINLVYNLSTLDLTPQDITNMTFGLVYCHSGEDAVNQDFCDNDAPIEKTADGAQNVEVYDFTNNVWVDIGDIVVHADEAMYNSSYIASGTIANYVNETSNEVLVRYEADFSDSGGDGFLAIDYATLTVSFTKLKRGAVSTIPGTIPFYTTSPNPLNYSSVSCLDNMLAGSGACAISWLVNATGALNSTHEFFLLYDLLTNGAYVSDGESTHINITISDSSLIPPTVTLNYPVTNFNTNNASVNFNCSATDTSTLKNMSLYGNFSGIFAFNGSDTLSGSSDSSSFLRTLAEGTYLWNCLAYDTDNNFDWGDANRTLTVDLTAPTINLTTPVANQSFSGASISFNMTAYDNLDSVLNCNLTVDSVVTEQFTANSGQAIVVQENLNQGTHYWNVTCIDDAGNYNVSETRHFTISDISPSVALITANNIYQQSSSITLQYLPTDNNGITSASLIINGSIFDIDTTVTNNALNSFSISLAEGLYNWTVNVSDVSNLTAQAAYRYFTIDNTAPSITLSAPEDNFSTNMSSIMFNFTVTDNVDQSLTCDLLIDGVVQDNNFAASNGYLISRTISNINDGIHHWNVTCIDDTGNTGHSQTFMLNVSNPPQVVLNNPADNYSYNYNNPTVYYTPTDNYNLSNCSFILDNQINLTNSNITNGVQNNFELEDISEGYHNWTVTCYDVAGLVSNTPETRRFLIDLQIPTITLHDPEIGAYNGTNIMFNYTAFDNYDLVLSCNLTIDGEINIADIVSPNATPVNLTVAVITEGLHYWNITCFDDAGNYNVSETWNFSNVVPPTVSLDAPLSGSLLNYSQNVAFVYQPYDNQGLANTTLYLNGIYSKVNNAPSNGALNTFYVNFSTEGTYFWQVNATDSVGLVGGSEVWYFKIDTSAPVIGVMNPVQNQIVDWNDVNFTFNVTDNINGDILCNVTIDDSLEFINLSLQNGSISTNSKELYDGNHNWSIICADEVGWVAYSGVINFSVLAAPRVTLNFPIDAYRSIQRNYTFNYTPADSIGIENCSLYINGVFNQTDSIIEHNQYNYFNVTNLLDGTYNWTVECMDELPDGNVFSPDPEIFVIDNQGPNIVLNYPPESQAINENDVEFNWTASDYSGSIIYCNLTVDSVLNQTNIFNISGANFISTVYGLADGPHSWSVYCIDDLGNPATSSIGNFTINQPDLQISNSGISFSNTNPNLFENITIFANVTNIGGNPATNVVLEFWDGLPGVGILIGNGSKNISVGAIITYNVSWNITTGLHNIYVLVDPNQVISELNETNNNATKNISVLSAIINSPANGSMFNNATVTLNFTLQDYTGGLINYTVFVDGVSTGQIGQVTDNVASLFNVTLAQGVRTIMLRATDALLRNKNSSSITLTIDYTAPQSSILTANNTWYNYSTPQINITATDNIDQMINYTIYANGMPNYYGNISNGSQLLINLNTLSEGVYALLMEAFDNLNNAANSSAKIIYVDLTPPAVNLTYPVNGANFTTKNISFNYTAYDNLANNIYCNLTLDGVVVDSRTVQNGNSTSYSASNLAEGEHYWNVTCRDEAYNINTSVTRTFNIYMGPTITLLSPANNYWSKYSTNTFYFNVSDETGLANCSLLLNGSVVTTKQTAELMLNGINNLTASGMNGNYTWAVECYDNTSYGAYNTSTSRNIYVDIQLPNATIYTLNDTWFNILPTIYFNLSDNMDTVLNYTVYVNGSVNQIGIANNSQNISTILLGLINGTYQIIIEAQDEALNYYNSTPIIIGFDTINPYINLTHPDDGANFTATNLDLNFTPYDNSLRLMTCSLTLDGIVVLQNYQINSGQAANYTAQNLLGGDHYWNVTCIDLAGNYNTSETRRFYIYRPDLYVNASRIYFNNSMPIENETILITATIENTGTTASGNFLVEFYESTPLLGGKQIGNTTINLSSGESLNVSFSYLVRIGTQEIYVFLDRNSLVQEENESNNNASKTLFVGLWHFALGDTFDRLVTRDAQLGLLFEWEVDNSSTSNIFVTDADSSINWRELQALGRDTSNNSQFNDFAELDIALNATNYGDSVNTTYTSGGSPKETQALTIYSKTIINVPVHNSTNNNNFKTGIIWDYGDGGTGYNGTQDVVFVTQVKNQLAGYNSTLDYEIRIPATLRSYKGPDNNRVDFYMEIR